MARQAGTSVSVVCDMEHGRLLPSEPNLRAIFCQGCGMSGEAFEDLLFDFYNRVFRAVGRTFVRVREGEHPRFCARAKAGLGGPRDPGAPPPVRDPGDRS